tara:strand:- start:3828 stop:4346 length:519 start_codon:yes stop_codon:yes gene_type:complete
VINWVGRRTGICLLLASLSGWVTTPVAAEPQLNAETACAAPVRAFQSRIEGAVNFDREAPGLQVKMLDLLGVCQQVVEQQLSELISDYADLPADSPCQQGLRDLEPFVPLFADMRKQIAQQRLVSHAEKRGAIEHFRVITPGVLRTVNGVFLHRYAVCEPESEIQQANIVVP